MFNILKHNTLNNIYIIDAINDIASLYMSFYIGLPNAKELRGGFVLLYASKKEGIFKKIIILLQPFFVF